MYEQALRIEGSTVVRAMAFAAELVPSDVDNQSYLFVSSVISQPKDPEGFPGRGGTVVANYSFDSSVATNKQFGEALLGYPSILLVIYAESGRWGDHDRSGNPYTVEDDSDEALNDLLEDMFPARARITERQLESVGLYPLDVQVVKITPHGGSVSSEMKMRFKAGSIFNPQPGDILYTLDGRDKRLAFDAQMYDRVGIGIELASSATVQVRLRNPEGQWGPLTEAHFRAGVEPQPGQLLISESHYHPCDPTPSEDPTGEWSSKDFEFVEVWNVFNQRLDLAGCAFTEGIRFQFSNQEFASGESLVVVKNREAFASRYRAIAFVGPCVRRLANGGEQLTLVNAIGAMLHGVQYDDREPWAAEADGVGSSLSLTDHMKPEAATSWAATIPTPKGVDASKPMVLIAAETLRAVLGPSRTHVRLEIVVSADSALTLERSLNLVDRATDAAQPEVEAHDDGQQETRWRSVVSGEGLTVSYRLRVALRQ